jgi:hypothetical protein
MDFAATQFDGGRRSFPPASDAHFSSNWPYEPPNGDYEKLFLCQAIAPLSSRPQDDDRPHSAGWLVPDETSVCKPVFVAHSLLAAIWLLRKSLPEKALSQYGWECLASAAQDLSISPPSSAQTPRQSKMVNFRTAVLRHAASQATAKRPTPLATSPPSKRTQASKCQSLAAQELSSHAATPEVSDCSELDEPPQQEPVVTTVTNNNRRAELARSKRRDALLVKERLGLGLIAPNDKASVQERAAYESIPRQDEPTIAWIIKQPFRHNETDFYSAALTPYFTACTLLERARALGNQPSQCHAAQFLQAWRARGSPFRSRGVDASSQRGEISQFEQYPSTWTQLHDSADKAFCFAWDMYDRTEGELATMHIEYRWAAALMSQAYNTKIAQIKHNDSITSNDRTRNRYGKGPVKKEALEALMKLVRLNPLDKDMQNKFRNRLARAKRWYTITQALGWGSLTLMPHDVIASSWVESTLRIGELDVWVELVKRENPDVYAASKALDGWLGPEGIAGGPIGEKETLSIESEAQATIYEIQDSEDDEDDECFDMSQSQAATPKTPAHARQLRQMTLPELFHPVDNV